MIIGTRVIEALVATLCGIEVSSALAQEVDVEPSIVKACCENAHGTWIEGTERTELGYCRTSINDSLPFKVCVDVKSNASQRKSEGGERLGGHTDNDAQTHGR